LSSDDYHSQTSAVVSFDLNQLNETFKVNFTDDTVVETNESFTVSCNSSDPRVVIGASCNSVVINIINDDSK
jgi:hypothetical protein